MAVIAHGHAHEVVAAGSGQHDGQVFDGVLVGAGMVGVAGVAAHRDAGQLAHEMVFQTGALDLAGIVEIFWADKADDGVDLVGIIAFRQAVVAGFEGQLVPAVVRVGGERRSLAGFKVHEGWPGREAVLLRQRVGFVEHARPRCRRTRCPSASR